MADDDASANNPQAQRDDDWLNAAASWWSQALSEAGAGFRTRMDAAAKLPPPDRAPTPLTDFDRHFQEHVGPKLLNLITALAPMVGRSVYGFSEACDAVWRVARKHGATHLSDTAQTSWLDWIASELVMRTDDPWPDGLITPERLTQITGEKG